MCILQVLKLLPFYKHSETMTAMQKQKMSGSSRDLLWYCVTLPHGSVAALYMQHMTPCKVSDATVT